MRDLENASSRILRLGFIGLVVVVVGVVSCLAQPKRREERVTSILNFLFSHLEKTDAEERFDRTAKRKLSVHASSDFVLLLFLIFKAQGLACRHEVVYMLYCPNSMSVVVAKYVFYTLSCFLPFEFSLLLCQCASC